MITFIIFFLIALFAIRHIGKITNGKTIDRLGRLEYLVAFVLALFYPVLFILIFIYVLLGKHRVVKFLNKYL